MIDAPPPDRAKFVDYATNGFADVATIGQFWTFVDKIRDSRAALRKEGNLVANNLIGAAAKAAYDRLSVQPTATTQEAA